MPNVESDGPPPRDAWVTEFRRLLPQWESLRDSSKAIIPISISRVNQFDAARLDVEMSAMLKEQLVKVFSLMKPGLLFQYEPELDAFLEFLIWRFSIWVDKPTPGNALMNLRYKTIVERFLKTRLVYGSPNMNRAVMSLQQRDLYDESSF
ncbi:hypothetical protein PR202_gb24479 [Eleusine coracana subsp. coracana]|uniref:RING-type E3 ubiquitin transferase (cysteine targeting) n=1 Tax=Eleusine coracana subsp. coracana TaxID=191504 RepID=A0AAV5FL36_ELECO|nr:hypothetical protein PR202_gb24479 [Eleusine coracana subsp. coracana]